jgi:hypothetical protein
MDSLQEWRWNIASIRKHLFVLRVVLEGTLAGLANHFASTRENCVVEVRPTFGGCQAIAGDANKASKAMLMWGCDLSIDP